MKSNLRHLFELNFATVILGSSGLLGKLIILPPPVIIFGRCVIAATALLVLFAFLKQSIKIKLGQNRVTFVLSGVLLAAHWVTYFFALKLSTVAIAFLTLFTFPIVTTLLEPIFLKTRLSWFDLLGAIIIFLGVSLLLPDLNFSNDTTLGAFLGLFSAVLYALRNILNKKLVQQYPSSLIMFYQLLITTTLLFPALFTMSYEFTREDLLWLLVLGVGTTAIGHTMFVQSFKHFSVSTASVITSMQPVYGIILAVLVLDEKIGWRVAIGGSLIILTVIMESMKQYFKKE